MSSATKRCKAAKRTLQRDFGAFVIVRFCYPYQIGFPPQLTSASRPLCSYGILLSPVACVDRSRKSRQTTSDVAFYFRHAPAYDLPCDEVFG